ncbi:hypothetical protein Gotur_010888 [Gossypium turneri]
MRVVNKRDGGLISLSLVFVMAILLISNAKNFRVDLLAEKINDTAFRGGHGGGDSAGLDDDDYSSFIGDDMELEMLTDSYIRRVLAPSNGKSNTAFTKNAKDTPSCGTGKPYGQCMGEKKRAENCIWTMLSVVISSCGGSPFPLTTSGLALMTSLRQPRSSVCCAPLSLWSSASDSPHQLVRLVTEVACSMVLDGVIMYYASQDGV